MIERGREVWMGPLPKVRIVMTHVEATSRRTVEINPPIADNSSEWPLWPFGIWKSASGDEWHFGEDFPLD